MQRDNNIDVNNMIKVLHACKTTEHPPELTSFAIGILWKYYQDYRSETKNTGVHITKPEYDCLCDLLFIPNRIRYGSKTSIERYDFTVESYKRYCAHCDKVWHILFNMRDNKCNPIFRGTLLGIMEEKVLRLVRFEQNQTEAVYGTLSTSLIHGIIEFPITFLYDFFNEYVVLKGAAESYTPYKFLQQYHKNIAAYGKQAAVSEDEYYEVVFKSNARKLPIYGSMSTGDHLMYNPWVSLNGAKAAETKK